MIGGKAEIQDIEGFFEILGALVREIISQLWGMVGILTQRFVEILPEVIDFGEGMLGGEIETMSFILVKHL